MSGRSPRRRSKMATASRAFPSRASRTPFSNRTRGAFGWRRSSGSRTARASEYFSWETSDRARATGSSAWETVAQKAVAAIANAISARLPRFPSSATAEVPGPGRRRCGVGMPDAVDVFTGSPDVRDRAPFRAAIVRDSARNQHRRHASGEPSLLGECREISRGRAGAPSTPPAAPRASRKPPSVPLSGGWKST